MSLRVLDLVRRPPVTVGVGVSVRDVVRVMYENSIGSIVIVDDVGRPIGIFTERDLLRLVAQGASLESPVDTVMSRDLVVVKGVEGVVRAAMLMSEHRIRHLPVVDDEGKLVGVISVRDVVDALRGILAVRAAEGELSLFTA
ncbi:MAG: CBS domain-containing protein [Desulfurococcaceae archaeon]|nr:CBS domain-containing protein [Desulfurococcaceae archaeon]